MLPHTVFSSATKEVVMGPDSPFVVIGERINPTGRKALAAEMKDGDFSRVESDALAQVAAGATHARRQRGYSAGRRARHSRQGRRTRAVDYRCAARDRLVDGYAALEAGLAAYKGKALLNSVTGEEERLESVLPLVKKYGCAVVAISNDDSGISEDIKVRFRGRQEDRRTGRRPRHSPLRRRRRPPRDADRRGRNIGKKCAAARGATA